MHKGIRLFPGPRELLVRWQSWKTLLGREAKSKPKLVNGFHQLPRTQIWAYCGFVHLIPTAEIWEHVEQARVQLNLPSKMQIASHTCCHHLHKHLHVIFSDNAFNVLVADLTFWPSHFPKNKCKASFLGIFDSEIVDCIGNKKSALI